MARILNIIQLWRSAPHLHNRVSPHNPLVPSTLARARRAYPSQARLGYAGAERSASTPCLIMFQLAFPLSLPRRGKLAFGRPLLAYGVIPARFHTLHNHVSPHNPLVPSTLARARRAYPSQARLGYAGAERSASTPCLIMFQLAFPLSLPRRGKLAFGRPLLAYGVIPARFHTLHNHVSPHNPLVPSTLARARRAYPSQARLGYAGAERSASHLALIQHHLIYIQIMVETALFKQFFVASLLNDAAVL